MKKRLTLAFSTLGLLVTLGVAAQVQVENFSEQCKLGSVEAIECRDMQIKLNELMSDYSDITKDQLFLFEPNATHAADYDMVGSYIVTFREYISNWKEADKIRGLTFDVKNVNVIEIKKSYDGNWIIKLEFIKEIHVIKYPAKGWVDTDENSKQAKYMMEVIWEGVVSGRSPRILSVVQTEGLKLKKQRPYLGFHGLLSNGHGPISSSFAKGNPMWSDKLNLDNSYGAGINFTIPMFGGFFALELGADYYFNYFFSSSGPDFEISGSNSYIPTIENMDLPGSLLSTLWTWNFDSYQETIKTNNLDLILGLSIPVLRKKLGISIEGGVISSLIFNPSSETVLFNNSVSSIFTFEDGTSLAFNGDDYTGESPSFPLIGYQEGDKKVSGLYPQTNFLNIYGGLKLIYHVTEGVSFSFGYRYLTSTLPLFEENRNVSIYGSILTDNPLNSNGFLSDYFSTGNLTRHVFRLGLNFTL